ncbi:MAG TPA: class I SAM-dependent methyltransferase, partial [Dissulfurispiraceae bacterium]
MENIKDIVLLKGKSVHVGIPSPSRAARFDVPYIPTPHEVVDEMLGLAGVGRDDLLYDLGCGDGRVVISAARQYGARGVGIDINPRRIMESCRNAHRARVRDKVRFLRKSLFDADISKATIVTLYLLSSVNMKLRPKLLRDLRPGTRIVSHEFNMGDWTPDQAMEVEGHPVYSWVVPANVRGEWEWSMPDSGGVPTICTLRL